MYSCPWVKKIKLKCVHGLWMSMRPGFSRTARTLRIILFSASPVGLAHSHVTEDSRQVKSTRVCRDSRIKSEQKKSLANKCATKHCHNIGTILALKSTSRFLLRVGVNMFGPASYWPFNLVTITHDKNTKHGCLFSTLKT